MSIFDSVQRFWGIIHDRLSPPEDPQPDLSGRNVIVTGSNVGVGFEAAVKFVQLGAARVVLGVRSLKKGEDAQAEIERRTGRKGVVEVWQVDMMDYESLKAFAKRVEREMERLDVACLNAGVAQWEYVASQYGWQTTLQVNTISTTLLSLLLLPKLRASKTTTFTPVLELISSSEHTRVIINPEARQAESPLKVYNNPSTYSGFTQYGVSKLFLQFAQTGLVKHVGPLEKSNVEIVTVCPGGTRSTIMRADIGVVLRAIAEVAFWLLLKPTEQGARNYVGAVTMGGKGHGEFFRYGVVGEPGPPLLGAENEKLQEKVWQDILNALRKDVPEVDGLLSLTSSQKSL